MQKKLLLKRGSSIIVNALKKISNSFKIATMIAVLLVTFNVKGQTTILIDPAAGGGFENATATPAANGWSATTSTNTVRNQWVVNTATKYAGNNSAYITNNTAGSPPPNTYSVGNARVSHLFQNFTIPTTASSATLSFYWKATGEGTTTLYDYMRCYFEPAANGAPAYGTQTPFTGTAPTGIVNAATAATAPTTATYYNISQSGYTAYQLVTITIPAAYFTNTAYRLTFEWRNDGSSGDDPPASIDNVSLSYVIPTPPAITSFTPTFGCVGSTITIAGTNFTGATAVTIGNTAVSSITSITATQIVAVVGSGTTGLVKVTSPSGTGTSSGTFTVNPIPIVAAITGTSTVCSFASITLSDSTPSGVWSVINGTGTATITPSGVLTGGTAGTVTVYYTVTASGCSTTVNYPVTISAGPIITIQPSSVAIADGANTSFSIVAAGSTSYSWQVSTNGGSTWNLPITNSAPYSTATTNSLTITGATALMNGYKYRATATNACGSTVSSIGILSIMQTTLVPSTGNNTVSCGTSTYLYDHAGATTDYSASVNGYTVLENSGTGIITLNGSYVTEAGYDYIYIYSGVGITGTLLYTYSGTSTITQVVSAAGQAITVQFTSEGSVEYAGFNFSAIYSGTCAVCSSTPSNLTTSAITTTTATLSWTATVPAPSSGYRWEVRTSGAGGSGLTGLTSSGSTAAGITTTNITGLAPNTTYYYYVRSFCGGTDYSAWVSSSSFYTGYCASIGSSSSYYINNFATTLGTTNITNNSSGYSSGGYQNATPMVVSQYANATVNFSTSFDTGGIYTYGFAIFVDWNNDLDFADSGEIVFSTTSYVTSQTGSFSVPVGQAIGNYRMRIVANYYNSTPTYCNITAISGETEDYTFTVVTLTPPVITSFSPASGCVGSTITINGTNFTGATAVTIGNTAVSSITSITATQIVAVVGTGTTGTVKVTTPGGTGTSSGTFTVNPIPIVAAITGASTVCVAASITLSDSTPSGVWSVTNGTGTATIISTTGVLTGGTAGTVTVNYTVTTGCSTTVNYPVTISAGPIITTQPSSVAIAAGANTSFSIVAAGSTSYSWQVSTNGGSTWSLPITNSAPYSTATNNSLTITGATALMNGYKYRATATNTCGSTVSSIGTLTISQFTLVPSTGNNAVSCGTSTLLYDHAGTSNYSANVNGYTVLENSGTGIITLNGSYVTELNYDYIYIYAGIGTSGTLLNTYHGTGNITQFVSAAGQSITVQFITDSSIQYAGFNFSVVYSGTCAICGNMATTLTTSAITSTTTTLLWTAASPAPSGGYQWEVRASGA